MDYSNFMFSLFILVTKGTFLIATVNKVIFFLFLINVKVKLYHPVLYFWPHVLFLILVGVAKMTRGINKLLFTC